MYIRVLKYTLYTFSNLLSFSFSVKMEISIYLSTHISVVVFYPGNFPSDSYSGMLGNHSYSWATSASIAIQELNTLI